MSTDRLTPDQSQFLACFFGPGNLLRWDAYNAATMPQASREFLSPLITDFTNDNVPVLLPRVTEAMPRTINWYAMAHDASESRALREQLAAFVGPTYTDFTGQHAPLSSTDPIECAVAKRFGAHVYRFRVVNDNDRERVRGQISLMRSFRDRHPDRRMRLGRPVGRLLRDLEMALLVRNEDSAWQCLDELRSRGRLSAHNLAFLKVRILAAFERWQQILDLPETTSLLAIRRPSRVSHSLVQAIYNVHLAGHEQSLDVGGCVQHFRDMEASLGTLFRTRREWRDPTVLKAFLVRAVASEPVRTELVSEIVREYPIGDSCRNWVDALAAFAAAQLRTVTPPVEVVGKAGALDGARSACESGDYDAAFRLLLDCEPDAAVIRQLLACSLEIDSLDTARRTLQYIDNCPGDVRNGALGMRAYRQMMEALTQRVASIESPHPVDDILTGWLPWLERLNARGAWNGADEVARYGALEWSRDEFLRNTALVSRFAELLVSRRPRDGDVVLRNVMPSLLTHFLPDDGPIRELKPIYMNLAFVLALDDAIGADDLTAIATLSEAILECAPATSAGSASNEFQELVETLEAAWNHVAAPRHVDWALHILDLLIAFNVRQHAVIDGFVHQVINGFREWVRRIRTDQWDLLEVLLGDLDRTGLLVGLRQREGISEEEATRLVDRLSGQSIAIYTLTERIGRRAAEVISSRIPGTKIHLVHDKVSTDRLEQLARNANIFIVNTWDAKHAATNAIQAGRPPGSVTLIPQSKAAGSLVRELYDFLSATPPAM